MKKARKIEKDWALSSEPSPLSLSTIQYVPCLAIFLGIVPLSSQQCSVLFGGKKTRYYSRALLSIVQFE
jgi:hypothetical protein